MTWICITLITNVLGDHVDNPTVPYKRLEVNRLQDGLGELISDIDI